MNTRLTAGLLGASVFALATAAAAQPAAPSAAPAAAAADQATLGEIVVTARRRSESLQEVPQTVNAVTSETLQKLNIRQFQDVQAVVPGLTLSPSATGFQNSASLRGVSFEVNTGAQPTVAFYLNDAPVQLSFVYQSLFDIGQVEVLKGPQGTTRGISAPSGAITITTHRPDLSEFGGYADVTLTDHQGRIAQGAINVPIIKDVLAVRVAGDVDTSDGDGVRSLHSNIRPENKTTALRASVSFEPNDSFNANVMYQKLDNQLVNFIQMTGPGQGPFTIGTDSFSAGVNPPLTAEQRASVQDTPNDTHTHEELVTAQVDSRIFGQHLSYVGSYSHFAVNTFQEGGSPSFGDVGNILPFVGIVQHVRSAQVETTHEIRLASDPAPGRFIDYTVGAFYHWVEPSGHIDQPGPLTPGAFGNPALPPSVFAYNPAYQIPIAIDIPSTRQETSLFGSVTLHLPFDTELSGGIRHMWTIANSHTNLSLENGQLALPASLFGGNCAALHFGSTYPGFCDFPLAGGTVISNLASRSSETPNIYNVSLSHHFTRDFLMYVNTGTAYRSPVASVGIQGQLANFTFPDGSSPSFHPSERSISYEIGFKSQWFDGRWRLNASMFRQRFHNFTLYVPNILFNNVLPGQDPATTFVPTVFNFTQSVDALVKGFDIDTAFQVTPNWSISAQLSYADGKVQGSMVPCNITDASGKPVFNTGNLISLCPGGSASRLPFWNATFQSEYTHPVRENADGFLRVLATYYPENKDRVEPDFIVPGYAMLNLYAGVRSHDGAWEASIFARNLLNKAVATDVSPVEANLNTSLSQFFPNLIRPSGYFQTTTTAAREIGVNVHYAFGSR
jgi:iron complex outermembrane receptor protein